MPKIEISECYADEVNFKEAYKEYAYSFASRAIDIFNKNNEKNLTHIVRQNLH